MLTRRHLIGLLAAAPAMARAATPEAGAALVEAARGQIGVTTHYDHGYRPTAYPGGDVPISTGVCADVVAPRRAPRLATS